MAELVSFSARCDRVHDMEIRPSVVDSRRIVRPDGSQ
jgi:hypothetical protein